MGVIILKYFKFVSFKQEGDNVVVYLNNRLYSVIPIKEFKNYNRLELINILYEFMYTKQTCNIVDLEVRGEVVLTLFSDDCDKKSAMNIQVGIDTKTMYFDNIDKVGRYAIASNIINYLESMKYQNLYEERSFRNLWGLLR